MIEPKVPVDEAYLGSGEWQVDIAGKFYPAVVSARPLYDPAMKRVHA
jgi:4-methylaminobutanoate oxidase (formaldehyde-forming)